MARFEKQTATPYMADTYVRFGTILGGDTDRQLLAEPESSSCSKAVVDARRDQFPSQAMRWIQILRVLIG